MMIHQRLVIPGVMTTLLMAVHGCGNAPSGPPTTTVVIGSETFTLEIAADSASRTQGLMNRESIEDHGGMMFAFPRPEKQSFWMGHCLVDMDIAFLDSMGRVTARYTMKKGRPQAPQESEDDYRRSLPQYPSLLPAQFAIELKAGTLDRLSVHVGDKVPIELERLKAMPR